MSSLRLGRDQFLSEDDLNLKELTWEELMAVWDAWLLQASSTDAQDAHLYSHGVFREEPGVVRQAREELEAEEQRRKDASRSNP